MVRRSRSGSAENSDAISLPPSSILSQEKPPVSRPGAWPCISLCSLCFCFFLFCADQVANGAACFASGLAGSLTFTAAFKLNGVLQRRLIDCNDMFGHDVTSPKQFFRINHIIEKRVNTSKNYVGQKRQGCSDREPFRHQTPDASPPAHQYTSSL